MSDSRHVYFLDADTYFPHYELFQQIPGLTPNPSFTTPISLTEEEYDDYIDVITRYKEWMSKLKIQDHSLRPHTRPFYGGEEIDTWEEVLAG